MLSLKNYYTNLHSGKVLRGTVSLCSCDCPETQYVDKVDLELRNAPASAFGVLGLKEYHHNQVQNSTF